MKGLTTLPALPDAGRPGHALAFRHRVAPRLGAAAALIGQRVQVEAFEGAVLWQGLAGFRECGQLEADLLAAVDALGLRTAVELSGWRMAAARTTPRHVP